MNVRISGEFDRITVCSYDFGKRQTLKLHKNHRDFIKFTIVTNIDQGNKDHRYKIQYNLHK